MITDLSSQLRVFSHFVKDRLGRCLKRSHRCWCEIAMRRSPPADISEPRSTSSIGRIAGTFRSPGAIGPALDRFGRHLQRARRCPHFGHTFRVQILHGAPGAEGRATLSRHAAGRHLRDPHRRKERANDAVGRRRHRSGPPDCRSACARGDRSLRGGKRFGGGSFSEGTRIEMTPSPNPRGSASLA
jgi:hypothetical protein